MSWIQYNRDSAKKEFAESAREIINYLKIIESKISS